MAAVAVAILGNKEDANDCLQDTLTAIWNRQHDLENIGNVRAYCLRAVRNRALNMLKQHAPPADSIADIMDTAKLADRVNPESSLLAKERLRHILTLIEALPQPQRDVIKYNTILGLSPEEISRRTGLSNGNVRTIISRIRKHLKGNGDDNQRKQN